MKSENRDLLIAYSLLPFLTPSRTRLLRETFEPLAAASEASSSLLQGLLSVTREQAELVKNPLTLETRKRVNEIRHNVVVIEDEGYSPLLREIIDPPLALHLRGEASLTAGPCVAIVGSRKASPYGINAARRLARDLVSAGVVIVSGLARGIDAAAHEAALEAGGLSLGGEQSGHLIFRELATTGDGVLTSVLLLDLVARLGRPLGELASGAMEQLPQALRSVRVQNPAGLDDAADVWAEVRRIEAELGGGGRVLLRRSGTEPLVRVMAEARTHAAAEAAVAQLCETVARALGAPTSS